MAFTAAANATQRVGNYAPGSLAAQPRRFAGGVRKRGESPDQMANRMDAGYMASAMQGGTSATPTRADNIAKARADGTFDAKRNAFNAANSGSFMDAAGNIGPKAQMPAPPASTPAPPASTPPSPSAPAPNPTAPAPAKPKGPAMFDGRPKAKFFADAASRGVASMPSGVYNQPDIAAKIKTREAAMDNLADNGGKPMSAPKPSPAPAAKPAGMAAAATSPKPYSGPMARPPGQVDAKPAAPTAAPTAKPAGIVAAASTKAPANGFSPEFHRRFDPTPSSTPAATAPTATKPAVPTVTPAPKPAGIVAAATPQAQPTQPKAETRQTASLPTANHSSPKPPAEPSLEELRQKAEAAKAARQPGLTKVAKSFVGAAQAVDKAVPAAVSSVTSGIKNTGDSIILAIDRGMAPARRWLYGSNQETPEEKAYREAMAKRKPATSQPAAKKQTPTFRTPYLPNRRTAFSIN